jgi:opacity protein-like surface antigen
VSDRYRFGALVACLATGGMAMAEEGERKFSAGLLATVSVANGEPANDIPGFGLQLRYAWNERWAVGLTLLRSEYDFETPAEIVGITQSSHVEPVDALAESTLLQGWAERSFRRGDATTWFVGAGLGASSVDVPQVIGPRADGGQFDVRTNADTEIVVTGFAGVRRSLGERWYAEFRVHANQHLADWQVEDRISGAEGSIDDYASFGGQLAVGMRW